MDKAHCLLEDGVVHLVRIQIPPITTLLNGFKPLEATAAIVFPVCMLPTQSNMVKVLRTDLNNDPLTCLQCLAL